MKTITDLEIHLENYHQKKAELPTYDDLIELIQELNNGSLESNLKTWPECVYLYGNPDLTYENQTGKLAWSEDNFGGNIKYIRADVVKERELKLIGASYLWWTDKTYDDPLCSSAIVWIYEDAGIEELK